MSGIVGVFNLDGEPVRPETLDTMCQAIEHRGPHGRGLWSEGSVGFGHVLLHTTEESLHEKQPLSLDGKTWITADARIDDRAGLIDLLNGHVHSGENLHEATDVCLLLHAYHAWGVDCVRHLTGVFAAAIWDSREHKLVCLRDQIGIKPFYYAHTSKRIVFASEVKGILASGLVPQQIYEPRIADYLVIQLEGVDKTCTFFEGVIRLPPAHRMVITNRNMRLEEYWTLNPTREIRFQHQRDYVEAFCEHFYKAVHCNLRGSTPVASMLSGGLDSSSIVAVARDILSDENKPDLSTFSMVNSKDPNCLETFYINQMIAQGGLDSINMEVEDASTYIKDLNKALHTSDDLFDHNIQLPQIIYIAAHQKGFTAMLDGVDGDLVMGQPGNHIAYLFQRYQFKSAIQEAKFARDVYNNFPGTIYTDLYGAFRSAFKPKYLRNLRKRWRGLRHQHTLKKIIKESIINFEFATKVDLLGRFETLQSYHIKSDRIDLRQIHANALNQPYLVVAIERYDRVASRYSIEPRHPILDRRMMEFCLALPWQEKITSGWTKMITRRSIGGLLPEKVVWRRGREHLGPQITAYLLSLERDAKNWCCNDWLDLLSPYVDIFGVKHALNVYTSSSEKAGTEGRIVSEALALANWLAYWKTAKLFDRFS